MKVFEIKYFWTDPDCDCVVCVRRGTPHVWSSETQIVKSNFMEAAASAEEIVRKFLQPGVSFEIYSIVFVDNYTSPPAAASVMAEDDTHAE